MAFYNIVQKQNAKDGRSGYCKRHKFNNSGLQIFISNQNGKMVGYCGVCRQDHNMQYEIKNWMKDHQKATKEPYRYYNEKTKGFCGGIVSQDIRLAFGQSVNKQPKS